MQKPGLQPSDTIQGGLRTGCEKEDEQGNDLEHAVADKRKKERKKERKNMVFRGCMDSFATTKSVSVTAKMKGTDKSIPLRPLSLSESPQSPQAAQTPKHSRLEHACANQGMRYEVA